MPYFNGETVSRKPLQSGIEISEGEYSEIRNAKLAGKKVVLHGGTYIVLSGPMRTVYSKNDKSEKEIYGNEPVPERYTTDAPGEFDEWGANGWVKNEEACRDSTRKRFSALVQSYMDQKAQERNYDGIMSLCTYATSTNPTFSSEGQAGVQWRDQVWSSCYQILEDVESGIRAIPSDEQLLEELPEINWEDRT